LWNFYRDFFPVNVRDSSIAHLLRLGDKGFHCEEPETNARLGVPKPCANGRF
jgi:hypothetical protein